MNNYVNILIQKINYEYFMLLLYQKGDIVFFMITVLFYFGFKISKLPFPPLFSNFHPAAITRFVSSRLKSKY